MEEGGRRRRRGEREGNGVDKCKREVFDEKEDVTVKHPLFRLHV